MIAGTESPVNVVVERWRGSYRPIEATGHSQNRAALFHSEFGRANQAASEKRTIHVVDITKELNVQLPALPPHGREAVRAVHRFPGGGLEGYLAVLAASGADRGMHLSLLSVATAAVAAAAVAAAAALLFPGCSAVRTASGLVDEAFAVE